MSAFRGMDRAYLLAALLAVAFVVVALASGGQGQSAGTARTASVYDEGPGGAGTLRRYLDGLGARTTTVQGERFAIDAGTRVLFVLGASELVTDAEAQAVRAFVLDGGTVVVATDLGLFERPLLQVFGMRGAGLAAGGAYGVSNLAFAWPRASEIALDRGTIVGGGNGLPLAGPADGPVAVAVREGRGMVYVVGSLGPFISGGLVQADNARFVLGLVRSELAAGTVAFDEYHHGFHPTSDMFVLLTRTWPGRALVFVTGAALLHLVLSGRRLGPPVPLDPRPARSSREYIRSFAGLVRRSGRGEIARRRMRADLRRDLARAVGLDPATPFDRVLATVEATDRPRAAEARSVDDALAGPLREDQLLRTVGQIDRIVRDDA